MIELNGQQLNKLKQHFIKCYPYEGVCFVVDNELIFLENIHPTPRTNFKVDKTEYLKYINSLQAVIHSHPYATIEPNTLDIRTPSPSDVNNQIKTDVPWGIVSVTKQEMSEILWFPSDLNAPLYDRPFIYGVNDCYEFIRSFYWQKYKAKLDKPLGHNWSLIEDSFINDNMYTIPFDEVPKEDLQPFDMVTFRKATNNISHFGVYLGGDRMGHQAQNKFSNIERYRKYRPFLYKVFRYNGDKNESC